MYSTPGLQTRLNNIFGFGILGSTTNNIPLRIWSQKLHHSFICWTMLWTLDLENFSSSLLRRETSYGLGCTKIDWMTPEINPFQYAREINASNTKGYEVYLILDGLCRSPLSFSNTLVFTIHSQQQQTRQECYISKC